MERDCSGRTGGITPACAVCWFVRPESVSTAMAAALFSEPPMPTSPPVALAPWKYLADCIAFTSSGKEGASACVMSITASCQRSARGTLLRANGQCRMCELKRQDSGGTYLLPGALLEKPADAARRLTKPGSDLGQHADGYWVIRVHHDVLEELPQPLLLQHADNLVLI